MNVANELANLAKVIGEPVGIKDLADKTVEVCKTIMNADACSIYIKDRGKHTLRMFSQTGYTLKIRKEDVVYRLLKEPTGKKLGLTGWIATTGELFITSERNEFKKCPEYRGGNYDSNLWGEKDKEKCQSFFGVPLKISNRIIGVMKVESAKKNHFRSDEKKTMFGIASSMVASAIYTALILESIHKLYTKLGKTYDSSNPYNLVAETCAHLVDAESCSIYILNKADRLVLRGEYGYDNSFINKDTKKHTYAIGEGQTGKVFLDYKPHAANSNDEVEACSARESKLYSYQWNDAHTCHSWYHFPFGTGEKGTDKVRKLGLMKVENKFGANRSPLKKGGFSEEDKEILEIFANAAIPLIDNIKRRKDMTDELDSLRRSSKFSFVTNIDEIFAPNLLFSLKTLSVDTKKPISKRIHNSIENFIDDVASKRDIALCDYVSLTRRHIEKLANKLGITQELIPYLSPLQEYRPVLFQLAGYREHFVHQFNVFLIGYLILNTIDSKHFLIFKNKLGKNAANIDVFRIWFLASLTHDIGYPLGKSGKWTEELLSQMFNLEPEGGLLNIAEPLAVRLMTNGADDWIRSLCNILQNKLQLQNNDGVKLKQLLLKRFFDFKSEDLIASLILIAAGDKTGLGSGLVAEAAAAIALHERDLWKDLRQEGLYFREEPFTFLLQYCDLVQEHGRPASDASGVSLTDWKVDGYAIKAAQNKISTTIYYSKKPSIWNEHVKPELEDIQDGYFTMPNLEFGIRYHSTETNIDFHVLAFKEQH